MNEFISMRDHFAGLALQSLIISQPNTAMQYPDTLVSAAYEYAAKMMELRKQINDDLR